MVSMSMLLSSGGWTGCPTSSGEFMTGAGDGGKGMSAARLRSSSTTMADGRSTVFCGDPGSCGSPLLTAIFLSRS